MIEIAAETTEDVVTLEVRGRLDANTSNRLEKALNEQTEGGASKLVIDCSSLEYISSSGLRVLLATAKTLKSIGGRMVLCGLNEPTRKVFDLSGLSSVIPIVSSRQEAIQSCSG